MRSRQQLTEPGITFEQLLCDPGFQEWVFDPSDDHAARWQRLMIYGTSEQDAACTRARNHLLRYGTGATACPLTRLALEWYIGLKQQIRQVYRQGIPEIKLIETCFQASDSYWQHVREPLIDHHFASPGTEQYFFKVIKPLFRSQSDYFGLRYHAQLFCAETVPEDQAGFWKRELMRLEKFTTEHALFHEYYTANCPDFDEEWFARAGNDDRHDRSPMDAQVSMYLALVKYQRYIHTVLNPETP